MVASAVHNREAEQRIREVLDDIARQRSCPRRLDADPSAGHLDEADDDDD